MRRGNSNGCIQRRALLSEMQLSNGGIKMYRLQVDQLGNNKSQLCLYKNRNYIKSVRFHNELTMNIVYYLAQKVDLNLDWEQLYHNLTERHCAYCGKPITTPNRKYCNKECFKKARADRQWQRRLKQIYQDRQRNQTIITEYKKNHILLPTGFNQIDDPKHLGNTNLSRHINPENDFEKEMRLIKAEIKRLKNYTSGYI